MIDRKDQQIIFGVYIMEFKSKDDIQKRANQIINIKQKDLIDKLNLKIKGDKNAMGDIFEAWFGKPKDSSSKPDLGIAELKATPFKVLKNGEISAKERLVLNIINYEKLDKETFQKSHFLEKNSVLEIGFYEYNKNICKNDWYFSKCIMYEMDKNPVDFKIIEQDWELIKSYVNSGKAEKINEGLTNYLAACTKGKNKHSLRSQPHSNKKAMQRAFSFKSSYMTTLLRNFVFGNQKSDSIIKDPNELKYGSIEEIVEAKFRPYIGKSVAYLIKKLNISKKNTTRKGAYNVQIVNKILGINEKNDKEISADEFEKASIIPKTIQFDYRNVNKESMSLPPFKFKELSEENWEDKFGEPEAALNIYLSESEFLFIVFKTNKQGNNILKGIKFYNIPTNEINGEIKKVWEKTKDTINDGVKLRYDLKTNKVTNNFVKASEHSIIHIRPHAPRRSYINNSYSDELPVSACWTNKPSKFSCKYMTKQSFWLNNDYIKRIVNNLLD